MRFTCVALAVIVTGSCLLAFAQEGPQPSKHFADSETVDMEQQIDELIGRVERLESQLAEMKQITAAIGLSQFGKDENTVNEDAGITIGVRAGGFDEGMMIDAIQHRMRWRRRLQSVPGSW